MKNKILVRVYVPSIDEEYETYMPSNESVKKILDLLVKIIYDLSDTNFDADTNHYLLDASSSKIYLSNQIIRETDIKNSKKIILI